MGLAGYDGMRVIYQALEATKGAGGEAMVNAMRGMTFESPRGPFLIDPETRDVVQNVYIRRVERVGGELYNVEFDTMKMVKNPRDK
jgi:branched-chain amino acid transport system substrate-binding protein